MVFRKTTTFLMLFALSGCGESLFSPAGPIAAAENVIILDAAVIMLSIGVPTILATLAFAWWFRASNTRARRMPEWSYSGQLELLVWSIPALVVLFVGGIAWLGSHELDPARPLDSHAKPLEVQVVSLDWRWLFIYPQQHIASMNRLAVPAGVPVHLSITSATVMNVFFVPRISSEIYAMNGMTTQLYLQADKPGVYPGLSAHFSGDGFSDMAFSLDAMPAEAFAAWVSATQAKGVVLDEAAYRAMLKQTHDNKAYSYRAVMPGLFDAIVMQTLPPGDGPTIGGQ